MIRKNYLWLLKLLKARKTPQEIQEITFVEKDLATISYSSDHSSTLKAKKHRNRSFRDRLQQCQEALTDSKMLCYLVSKSRYHPMDKDSLSGVIRSQFPITPRAIVIGSTDLQILTLRLWYCGGKLWHSLTHNGEPEDRLILQEKALEMGKTLISSCEEATENQVVRFQFDFTVDRDFSASLFFVRSLVLMDPLILHRFDPQTEQDLDRIATDIRNDKIPQRRTKYRKPTVFKFSPKKDEKKLDYFMEIVEKGIRDLEIKD